MSAVLDTVKGSYNVLVGSIKAMLGDVLRLKRLQGHGLEQRDKGRAQLAWGREKLARERSYRSVKDDMLKKLYGRK